MSDKNIHQKINIFLLASIMRGLSQDDKTKDFVDRNIGGQINSLREGNIHGENLHI